MNNRYIYEDIPMSLVPMLSTAKMLNIETPMMDSIMRIGSAMTGVNFYDKGRTLKSLGIKSIEDLKERLKGGIK